MRFLPNTKAWFRRMRFPSWQTVWRYKEYWV